MSLPQQTGTTNPDATRLAVMKKMGNDWHAFAAHQGNTKGQQKRDINAYLLAIRFVAIRWVRDSNNNPVAVAVSNTYKVAA